MTSKEIGFLISEMKRLKEEKIQVIRTQNYEKAASLRTQERSYVVILREMFPTYVERYSIDFVAIKRELRKIKIDEFLKSEE